MNEKTCTKGVTIVQIPDECNGGNYLSTSCIQTPNSISYLDLSAGVNQTQINAALVSSLIYKDQQINDLEVGGTSIQAGENIELEGDGTNENPYIINSTVDLTGLVDLTSNQIIDGEKSFIEPISGVDATQPEHLVTLSQLDLKAPLISPTFTGIPEAPTAPVGTNTDQIATMAALQAVAGNMQSVYNNSSSPQITTSTALGALTLQRGSGADTDIVFRVRDGVGTSKATITGEGRIIGSELTSTNNATASNWFVNNRVQMANNTYLAWQGSTFGNIIRATSTGFVTEIRFNYSTDLSSTYTDRSVVDKGYSDKNRLIPYTVATLPLLPSQGDSYLVTDADSPTYLGIASGGGSTVCPVFYNGTNWITH